MSNISVQYEDNSSKVDAELEKAVKKALTSCGEEARKYARQYLKEKGAVKTGNLRNSIAYQVDGNTMQVGTSVEYAQFVEFGTIKKEARAYLEPAIADHTDKYKSIIKKELGS